MSTATSLTRRTMIGMMLALAACKSRQQIIEITGFTMGTTYNVAVVDHGGAVAKPELQAAIDAALRRVNQRLSNWDAGSEVSLLNAAGGARPASMSPELAQVLAASEAVHAASAGRFDTALAPLIELWGFGAGRAPGTAPTPDAIAAALETSGQVHLAGLGKGFGADEIGRVLAGFGLTDYLVEIGGDLYASGRNPDGLPWQIGIEEPNAAGRSLLGVVGVSGKGLATSGDYRNYFEVGGQRFSHLIDPTTGYPVTHRTASATVIHDDAMLADAWSTAMLILGRAQGLEIAAQHNIAVRFIEKDRADGQMRFVTTDSAAFEALSA